MWKHITYHSFIEKYIGNLPDDFNWQSTPLQIYPLEFISRYLILPTPYLKADYHFMIYMEKGSYQQKVGINNHSIEYPSVLYVPEGQVFACLSIPKRIELKGFFLLLHKEVVSSITSKIPLAELLSIHNATFLNTRQLAWFQTVFKLLYEEMCMSQPNRKIATGFLQALMQKLIIINSGKKILTRQDEIANNFKNLLTNLSKSEKTVSFYAKELSVSVNYLNRCVKSYFNKSCKQMIQESVIHQSQLLMFDTSKDISEISFEMGYDDPSYFSRVFRKVTGQTPSEFKTQINSG